MTDATNVDNPETEGADGNQPPVSQEKEKSIAGAPLTPQELLEFKKELALTRSELKGLQSRQDKEQNEIQRFMEDVKAQMAKGKSFEEAELTVNAEREAKRKDDLLIKIAEKIGVLDNSPQNAAGNGRNAAADAAKVFDEFGVPLNDPEAAPLFELQGEELIKGVAKLSLKRAKQTTPDSSEAPALQSRGAPNTMTMEEKIQKYQSNMLAARGNKNMLKSIKEQARKDGVPVDSIVFV